MVISGKRLLSGFSWNFIGMILPVILAFFAIPFLIQGYGNDRFGFLSIIWLVVGYFSVFDLGLSRSLTKIISNRLSEKKNSEIHSVAWSGLTILIFMGFVGMIVLFFLSRKIVESILKIPIEFQTEAATTFEILSLAVPITILTSGFIGILEAFQQFKYISVIRVFLGILSYCVPLVIIQFTNNLVIVVSVLLFGRLLALVVFFKLVLNFINSPKFLLCINIPHLKELLKFGSWLTITNLVSPLMTYLDRFFISSLLGVGQVVFYVTPYEFISRLQLVLLASMGVLFPAMTAASNKNESQLNVLFSTTSQLLFYFTFFSVLLLLFFSSEIFSLWIDSNFYLKIQIVFFWFSLGTVLNVIAQPSFTLLQSCGRADITAKIHLIEILPYFLIFYFLTKKYGIAGSAAAWCFRILFDSVVLNIVVLYVSRNLKIVIFRNIYFMMFTFILFSISLLNLSFQMRLLLYISILFIFFIYNLKSFHLVYRFIRLSYIKYFQ